MSGLFWIGSFSLEMTIKRYYTFQKYNIVWWAGINSIALAYPPSTTRIPPLPAITLCLSLKEETMEGGIQVFLNVDLPECSHFAYFFESHVTVINLHKYSRQIQKKIRDWILDLLSYLSGALTQITRY